MRQYLLDTAPLVAYLQGRPTARALIEPWRVRREVATSTICYAEICEYLKSFSDFDRRRLHLRHLLQEVLPYSLTYVILERYADIRRSLRPPHGPGLIGDLDTLIAATAVERNLTLVTTDRDYKRVPSLKLMLIERKDLRSS